MKLNKFTLSLLLTVSTLSTSVFVSANNGEIHFSGQVVNSPCNIESDSLRQEVSFGQLSRTYLEAGNATEKIFLLN